MIPNLKFYLLAALFVAVLVFGGITLFNQHNEIQAQREAFKIFEKESESQRRKLFLEIELLKVDDRALEATIQNEREARKTTEAELYKLRTEYEKTNFSGFSNDSLADFFAKRRATRQR